jgi:predicted dehydrogenase
MEEINLGVIGFGSFAMFAVQQFLQVPGVKLTGMSGTHREAAFRAAERFGVPEIQDVDEMLKRDDIDLVYISTPPFMHHPQAVAALKAGKHVIVEKPFATALWQANEMISFAKKNNLIIAANLMQRYNPMYERIAELIKSKALGELLHCYFENYAADEFLPPEHWFWDKEKSGGIFIEHGVHFFDMFEGWLGKGEVVSAQALRRGETAIEDQVQCIIQYGEVLVNFYHGFTQPARLDRQEMRFLFEKGDVTLYEWIPSRMRLHAISSELEMNMITRIFSGSTIDVLSLYAGNERIVKSRSKVYETYQEYELHFTQGNKYNIYGSLLRAMLTDQIEWIKDKKHKRKITEQNGKHSLQTALQAEKLAHK